LAAAAEDADGAVAIVFNCAAIETVVGTKEGKDFVARDGVTAWLTNKHASITKINDFGSNKIINQ
jgi:hypothetical protein